MVAAIRNVTFDCPDARALASFYAELIPMPIRHLDTPDRVEIGNDRSSTRLAFATVQDYRAPTWPDPAYPQQLHLCGPVQVHGHEAESPTELVQRLGATLLPHQGGDCPVYADPAGHPFCLCAPFPVKDEQMALRGLLGGTNIHCFGSPRVLAAFYAELLDTQEVVEHEWGEVDLIAKDRTRSDLGFHGGAKGQQPRWLDPERPPQIHLDIEVDDLAAAENLVARLGATRLPDMGADCVVYADLEGHPFCLYKIGRRDASSTEYARSSEQRHHRQTTFAPG
jgi:Glyoxalase-like domain